MSRTRFKLTVPSALFDAVSARIGLGFAESYLTGATLNGAALLPRTLTGYERMRDRSDFRDLLRELNVSLVEPTPYPGAGDRMSADEIVRERF